MCPKEMLTFTFTGKEHDHTCGRTNMKIAVVAKSSRTGGPSSPRVLQRKDACNSTPAPLGKGAAHLENRKTEALEQTMYRSDVPQIIHEVLHSPGEPLDSATRAVMEPRFGHNFGQVRIHATAKAAESARAIQALAYTVGHDVVFGAGQLAPYTAKGQRLLAHELAHVVQQDETSLASLSSNDSHEAEADNAAEAVVSGKGKAVVNSTAPVSLARQVDSRHTRGYGGEQSMGFNLYSAEEGWMFVEGPSGAAGHGVTGKGFDGIAYNPKLDELHLLDNKSLKASGNVASATAIDPSRNLGKNLDAAIGRVEAMRDMPNRIRILDLLRAEKRALDSGGPFPSKVKLIVTGEGGRSSGVTPALQSRGVEFRRSAPVPTTPAAPKIPAAIPVAPIPQSLPPLPVVATTPAKLALETESAIGKLAAETRRSMRVAGLVKGGVAIFGVAMEALSAINSISEASAMASEGTILGDAQRSAERLRSNAADVRQSTEAQWDSISFIAYAELATRLEASRDSDRLMELSGALGKIGEDLDTPVQSLRSIANSTRARASAAAVLAATLMKAAGIPQGLGTAQQASEFALAQSLEKLGGTLSSAATDYEQAALFLGQLKSGVDAIAHNTNQTAWRIMFQNVAGALQEREITGRDAARTGSRQAPTLPGAAAQASPNGSKPAAAKEKQLRGAMMAPPVCPGGCHESSPPAGRALHNDFVMPSPEVLRTWLEKPK